MNEEKNWVIVIARIRGALRDLGLTFNSDRVLAYAQQAHALCVKKGMSKPTPPGYKATLSDLPLEVLQTFAERIEREAIEYGIATLRKAG